MSGRSWADAGLTYWFCLAEAGLFGGITLVYCYSLAFRSATEAPAALPSLIFKFLVIN
jgi:hypothetical protein